MSVTHAPSLLKGSSYLQDVRKHDWNVVRLDTSLFAGIDWDSIRLALNKNEDKSYMLKAICSLWNTFDTCLGWKTSRFVPFAVMLLKRGKMYIDVMILI